ncbi:MAG: hypothetical protein WCH65_06680 [bacterium]
MKNKKTLPEKVWLTEECDGVPEGSCIHVESETATTYTGTWASQLGSFPATVEKQFCSETSQLQETLKNVSNYLKKNKK